MPFRDWSEEDYEAFQESAYQNIFAAIDGVQGLSDIDQERAEELFDQGWLTFGSYSKERIEEIRNDFYNLVGIEEWMFDWEEYRELYAEAG